MIHLNGNRLCALSIKTTGPDPAKHEIVNIACIPLNHLMEPSTDYMPFILNIKPQNPDSCINRWINKERLIELLSTGMDTYTAANLFEDWVDRLGMKQWKQIYPLVYDWGWVRSFLVQWLSLEGFEQNFGFHYRDLLPAALYLNDRAEWHGKPFPFQKVDEAYIINSVNMNNSEIRMDASQEALTIAKTYKEMYNVVL